MGWISIKFLVALVVGLFCLGNVAFGDDDDVKGLPKRFLARGNVPRPTIDFPAANMGNMTANLDAFSPCGSTNDIYNGDNFQIRATSNCARWTFNVQPNVNVDLMCNVIDVPCQNLAYIGFLFSFSSRVRGVCSIRRAFRYRIQLRTRRSTYSVDINLETRGRAAEMDCVVIGIGGETRPGGPDPTTTQSPLPTTTTTTTQAPPSGTCGTTPGAKIVNGRIVGIESYPWQAFVGLGGIGACGGTLISSTVLLSAAHCTSGFGPNSIQVGLGCSDLSNCDLVLNGVQQVINHESYNFPSNDISLIRLRSPVTFTRRIQPACLPTRVVPTPGYLFDIVGYGRTVTGGSGSRFLRMANVRTITDSVCDSRYSGSHPSEIVCANPVNGGGTCQGDSGGFVGSQAGGRYSVDGVVSFGGNRCEDGFYGYTEVFRFLSWINARL